MVYDVHCLVQDTEGRSVETSVGSCLFHKVTPYLPYLKQPNTSKEVASNKGFYTIFPLFLWSISASCVFVKRIWLMQWPESYEIHKRFHKLGVALIYIIHYYPLLSIVIHYYPLLSIIIHYYPLFGMLVLLGRPWCDRRSMSSPLRPLAAISGPSGTWLLRGCCLKLLRGCCQDSVQFVYNSNNYGL